MAATNFTPISLYFSTTAAATPSAGNLVAGELALNTTDEKLYFKNAAGTVKLLASNASTGATVSSVAMTVPSLLSIAGSPITSSGTLAVTYSGTALPVANGGTGLTAGTSGGVLAYTATGTLASSALLTQYGVLYGGGAGAAPAATSAGTATHVLTSNGSGSPPTFQVPAAGGVSYTAVKTANYTAVNNDGVLTNTTGGAFTVTLPTSPSVGNIIVVVDSFSQWGTNNLTIDPTALIKIAGNTAGDTLTCDITGATVTLVYTGASYGWNVSAQVGGNGGTAVTLTGVQTLTNKTIAYGSNTLTDVVGVTATQTLTNKTLTNPTVTNYVETVQALGTVGASSTLVLTTGTVLTATLTASTACTFTMPTATAGKSFILILTQAATGMTTATFTSVKFPGGTAPTITATASAIDILTFVANGTSWFGTYAQAFA